MATAVRLAGAGWLRLVARIGALHAVGMAQRKADSAAALKALAEAARDLAREGDAPCWSPMFRQYVRDLSEAGGHKEALAMLDKEKSPAARALGLIGVVEGIAAKQSGEKRR